MTRLFIATKTATQAMRCKEIFKAKGYYALVQKRTSLTGGGCSYGVEININRQEAEKILANNNIRVLKIYEI